MSEITSDGIGEDRTPEERAEDNLFMNAPMGAKSTEDEIKLGRVGHYSYQEVCQTAMIVHVHPKQFSSSEGGELPRQVNVAGWDHEGNEFSRRGVPFGVTDDPTEEFHLNRDCPDSR